MDLMPFFKSVLEQDRSPIVLCDLNHTVIYMNGAAIEQYANRGGADLLGKNLLCCHNDRACELINKAIRWFSESKEHNIVYEYRNDKENKDVYTIALRDGEGELIGYYEKHEYRDRETAKIYDFAE